MGRRKCQSGRSPTIWQGGRGSKAGEGSTVASRVEVAPPEWKRPTSSNRKKKVDRYGLTLGGESREVTEKWEDHLIAKERRNERTVFPWQAAPGYLQCFESVSHQFAKNLEHVTRVVDEDEPTLRNFRALDVALRFRTMPKTNVTAENAIAMVDAVIAFLSRVKRKRKTW
ncbi:hypothetical protein Syun_019644 [Stephania yunnanensis]|uniref:Uncharacterized protein n=1 Tax=Stephania yunnanensis TaxID=152371 RepID=A0AAP0IWH6_9MAGN